jgi:signal transduction histidine kinase
MAERVKMLDGTILIEAEAGKGTTIGIELWKPTLKL